MSRFASLSVRSTALIFIAATLISGSPAYAQASDDPAQLVGRLIDDDTAEERQVAELAMRIVMLGQPGIVAVTKALETETDHTAILRLTYALGAATSQMGGPAAKEGSAARLPDAAIDRLVDLANNPPHPLIQLNAMFALASAGPRALEAVPAIIKLLGEEEDENARAGIQYWLAQRGDPALPILIETLKTTENERLQGDIALTLQGQALSEDVTAFIIDALAKATRDDTRAQLARVLTRMEPVPQAARPAFITALARVEDDVERVSMAYALNEVKGDASETAKAFAEAALKTGASNERTQMLRLLLMQGSEGVQQWATLASQASDDEIRSDLLLVNPAIYSRGASDETVISGLIAIIQGTANEAVKKDAIFNLARLGEGAREKIEQQRSQTPDMKLKESLSAAIAIIASQEKKTP